MLEEFQAVLVSAPRKVYLVHPWPDGPANLLATELRALGDFTDAAQTNIVEPKMLPFWID